MLEFMNALRSLPDEQARRFVASELKVDGKSWTDLLALKRQEPAFGPIVETIADAASRGRQAHEQATWEAHIAAQERAAAEWTARLAKLRKQLERRAGADGDLARAKMAWIRELENELAAVRRLPI
jgi:hypothetical protein